MELLDSRDAPNVDDDTEKGIKTLCSGLFDYSGMFPPAALSLEETLRASAGFPTSLSRPYLIGTDIVLDFAKVALLSEELLVSSGWSRKRGFSVAVLGGTYSPKQFSEVRETIGDSPATGAIHGRYKSLEWKISSCDDIESLIEDSQTIGNPKLEVVAIEPDLSSSNWESIVDNVLAKIKPFRDRVALKIRGTGPTAIGNEKISNIIVKVSELDIMLKATGGLHHPILAPAVYQNNLGFLNLIVALSLSRSLGGKLPTSEIRRCLDNDRPDAFEFANGLTWQNYRIPLEEVNPRLSIGSCSISEPDQDLQNMPLR